MKKMRITKGDFDSAIEEVSKTIGRVIGDGEGGKKDGKVKKAVDRK